MVVAVRQGPQPRGRPVTAVPREVARRRSANLPALLVVDDVHQIVADAELVDQLRALATAARTTRMPVTRLADASRLTRRQRLAYQSVALLLVGLGLFCM